MDTTTQNSSPEATGAKTAFAPVSPESTAEQIQERLDAIADREGKYLTFTLAGEEYGISILKIKEIIGMMAITSVPQTPRFVKGVINLRGKVIPVVDLRLRFTMESIAYNERTCIIVVEIGGRGTDIVIGIVVDSVSEVLNIKGEDIEDTPTFGTSLNTDYILGMAKMEGKVKILLDIDQVLGAEDIDALPRAA
jgi:purine-binding chemotaxis protein CheW